MSKADHKGTCISMWMSDEEMKKIEALMVSSGQTRTALFKNLLAGRSIPDKSYWKTYRQLAQIGGLIKRHVDNGQHGSAYKLGCEVVRIARELEKLEKERSNAAGLYELGNGKEG